MISADTLHRALKLRHAKDLIVNECKNGPTHVTKQLRTLDAWVLVSTWSPITTIGYEIKVSRSDWLRDKKIEQYMGLCHLFYIVAPKGLIAIDELPPDVGLIEALGDGTRLVARKRAGRREIELPVQLMTYVLMSRVVVTAERDYNAQLKSSRMDELQRWAVDENNRKTLAWQVSEKIRKVFADQERRLGELEQRAIALEAIKRRVVELGFDPDKTVDQWHVSHRLRELSGDIDAVAIIQALARTSRAIDDLTQRLETKRAAERITV
jgi:hypothetical protein